MNFFDMFKKVGNITTFVSPICLLINFFDSTYSIIDCDIMDFIKMLGLFTFLYSLLFLFVYIVKIFVDVMKNTIDHLWKDLKNIALVAIINTIVAISFYYLFISLPSNQVLAKPIIYLYPEKNTNITVTLSNPERLTHTYPKYKSKWEINATSNGTLTDLKTEKKYYALYWEAIDNSTIDMSEGFIVAGKDVSKFLEEKLEMLGLNYKESQEFVIYWLPILESNKYNFIRFRTQDEINNYMELDISPKPDTIIRVIMDFKKINKPISIKEQTLENNERIGFTVVEWGAREIK